MGRTRGKKRPDFLTVAKEALASRHPEAKCAFVAGSIVRGESTSYSDIDLVVIFDKLPQPRRENFVLKGWPIEVFTHDPETMNYFFWEVDAKDGRKPLKG